MDGDLSTRWSNRASIGPGASAVLDQRRLPDPTRLRSRKRAVTAGPSQRAGGLHPIAVFGPEAAFPSQAVSQNPHLIQTQETRIVRAKNRGSKAPSDRAFQGELLSGLAEIPTKPVNCSKKRVSRAECFTQPGQNRTHRTRHTQPKRPGPVGPHPSIDTPPIFAASRRTPSPQGRRPYEHSGRAT